MASPVTLTVVDSKALNELKQMIVDLQQKTEVLADQAKRNDRERWLTMDEAANYTRLNRMTLIKHQRAIGRSQPTGGKNLIFKLGDLEDWFYDNYVKQKTTQKI